MKCHAKPKPKPKPKPKLKPNANAMQILAVILGIALTYIIRPGRDKPFEHGSGGDCATKNTDTIMGKKCGPLIPNPSPLLLLAALRRLCHQEWLCPMHSTLRRPICPPFWTAWRRWVMPRMLWQRSHSFIARAAGRSPPQIWCFGGFKGC